MTSPIDIIVDRMCGTDPRVNIILAAGLAEAAANTLTDDRIVTTGAKAIEAEFETLGLSEHERMHLARVVLRSVGGA
jgi:hypothetical protein